MRHLLLVPLGMILVAGCGPNSSTEPPAIATQDRAAWRKLAKGMTPEQVRTILGEPRSVEDQGEVICWHYQSSRPLERDADNGKRWILGRGAILFSNKVAGGPHLTEWREP